ncbi:MAG: glycine--tRNA ligase subunit alpha [Acidobacteriota bacterium]|nr:glycine--tRNA ligase subunit alpha [Acidobacteriota bacterium]
MTRNSENPATFQDMIIRLSQYWAAQGCVLALPYDLEVGAGTMCPETFFRVLGPDPWRVAYVQPSRRPADGRYGENPNRLIKHTQMQVILKPPPVSVQDVYLESLESLGVHLRDHDIRFEEDNWESPTLGAWGLGWQVLLDGLEITQFTYFQQCGGIDLEPVSAELTYGLERIAAFLQGATNVYDLKWDEQRTYGEMRLQEELELSVYDFEQASPEICRQMFDLSEEEAARVLAGYEGLKDAAGRHRFPLRKAFELCLKCSHLFNILDARGAVSVTERVALIGRVRKLACQVAAIDMDRKTKERLALLETANA